MGLGSYSSTTEGRVGGGETEISEPQVTGCTLGQTCASADGMALVGPESFVCSALLSSQKAPVLKILGS